MDDIDSEPVHLNNHHRNTLRQILQHPAGHNIEWHAVVSLLEAVGSVTEHRDGKVATTLGSGPSSSTLQRIRTSTPRPLSPYVAC